MSIYPNSKMMLFGFPTKLAKTIIDEQEQINEDQIIDFLPKAREFIRPVTNVVYRKYTQTLFETD